ncbi:hypothetical protein KEU06_26125 [Pseudaminobacter sp. 19-2017]|uniref:Uncharacterized protein n=1 Tax=Pseudaminobacter soli (ex Zhang et al. 2022) TaxID=2831468 RepID=A0A942I4V8_9HYPH|nr:hypothetical protein [Pseudaminobacter soli]MBS3652084.1 hypothetical protein [Pseudaminobacter soli]
MKRNYDAGLITNGESEASASSGGFVVDATVVSQTWPCKKDTPARRWADCIPPNCLFVPEAVLEVIDHGIASEETLHPTHGRQLRAWKAALFTYFAMRYVPECQAVYETRRDLEQIRQLHWLSAPDPRETKQRLFQDIRVASTALVLAMPIASTSPKKFVLINRYMRLPGLFNPAVSRWVIDRQEVALSHEPQEILIPPNAVHRGQVNPAEASVDQL